MNITFKAIIGQKFGVTTWTLIGTSFYDYTQFVTFAPSGDILEKMHNRNRSVMAEKAVANYVMEDLNPGWASPICEFFPGTVDFTPTDDPNICFITIKQAAIALDGQARLGGCMLIRDTALNNNDEMLMNLLKSHYSGIELMEYVNPATSLKRFTDMNTCRVVDPGYIKLTSTKPKYARIKHIFEHSKYFNGKYVAMCAEDFKNNARFRMHFNQLFTITNTFVKTCDKNNISFDKMVEMLDYCYVSLCLPENFRFRKNTNIVVEHSTVFKNLFKAFADLINQFPESYRLRLDKMSLHADWSKDNSEILGGYILPNKKMQTGHQEGQTWQFTKYMLGLSLRAPQKTKMERAYLDANIVPNEYNKEIKINTNLPEKWVDRSDEQQIIYSATNEGIRITQ